VPLECRRSVRLSDCRDPRASRAIEKLCNHSDARSTAPNEKVSVEETVQNPAKKYRQTFH